MRRGPPLQGVARPAVATQTGEIYMPVCISINHVCFLVAAFPLSRISRIPQKLGQVLFATVGFIVVMEFFKFWIDEYSWASISATDCSYAVALVLQYINVYDPS